MSRLLRWHLAILIFIAVIIWVERELGWARLLSSWQAVTPAELLGLSLLTLGSYLLRAFRLYLYFGRPERHPFAPYVRISLLHNALNNFLPMRLGEASFPLLMKRHFRYSLLRSGAGLLWIRLMDLHWLLLLLSLVTWHSLGPVALAGTGLLLLAPLALLWRRSSQRPESRLHRLIGKLEEGLPNSYRFAGLIYGLTALLWILKLMALTLVMLVFIDLPGLLGLLAVISADLSSVLPIHGLAGSGTFEAAMLAVLLPLDIAQDRILLAAVNVHLYLLAVTVLSLPIAWLIPAQSPATLQQN